MKKTGLRTYLIKWNAKYKQGDVKYDETYFDLQKTKGKLKITDSTLFV